MAQTVTIGDAGQLIEVRLTFSFRGSSEHDCLAAIAALESAGAPSARRLEPPKLAAFAAELGYADQARFQREFKVGIGRTPGSFTRYEPVAQPEN